MKKNFKEQFDNLKNILDSNTDAIRGLIQQSKHLSEIIAQLESENAGSNNDALRKSLENIRADITSSIEKLIEQTKELFKTYGNLVDEVFDK